MNTDVSFNFHILPAEKTFLAAVSGAALYGKGIFTTLAVYKSKPFLWEKHWRRLRENSTKIGIDLRDYHENTVRHALSDLVLLTGLKTGRARLTFFEEAAGGIWNFGTNHKTSLLITTTALQNTKSELRLTVSPFPVNSRSPLAGIKSCNYLENLLAIDDARQRGFDEAIRLNERDEIVSAAMANIFWVKDGEIYTPALETGCLAGTTRGFLLENFPVTETTSGLAELDDADEIFLSSAGIGFCAASFENGGKKSSSIVAKANELLDLERLKA